jgi:ABC-type branched-subunit amino acid transport system permease subunit
MEQGLQHLVNGTVLGGTYALLGIGLTLIFGVMRVVNFTHGEFYTFGAYMAYALVALLRLDFYASLAIAALLGVALGAAVERILLRPLRNADIDSVMLAMIGAALFMQNAEMWAWGGVAKLVPSPFSGAPLVFGPVSVLPLRLFVLLVAVALLLGFWLLLDRTRIGTAMRATFQDAEAAALMGVPVGLVHTATFAIGSGLAAAAGSLLGPVFMVSPTMGDLVGLKAFAIVILGGLGNLPGAAIGGLALGYVEEFGSGYLSTEYRDAFGFVLIVLVLAVRPQGLVAAMAALPLAVPDPYLLSILTSTGIFVIGAISLNLLLGYTGQLSLGHAAFFGVGAYASALVSLGFDVGIGFGVRASLPPQPAWVGFAAAVAVAALFGWLLGRLAFRVRGAYFVIVTISFAQVLRLVALNWVELTQGPMALSGVPAFTVWWPGEGVVDLTRKDQTYWLVLAVGVVSFLIVRQIVHSRIGRALVALRENETLARSVGIRATHYLVVATVVSAGIAGAAGSLFAHSIRIVDPDVFLFIYTVTMVIMVITGGKGTLWGPVVGGLIFGLLPDLLRGAAPPEAQWMLYGAAMVLIVMFLPRGIVPAVAGLLGKRVRRAPGMAAPAPAPR